MHPEIIYQIALSLIPGIGPVKAKSLISHCGSAQAVFREKPGNLVRIPEIGTIAVRLLRENSVMKQAEQELFFIENNHILPIFYTDTHYSDRLKLCDDGPILLYTKGKMDLNTQRVISIVGTRTATAYGRSFCAELLKGIKSYSPLVVSGLAYGIDICAHKHAVELQLATVACVAHGLDKIYPPLHSSTAHEMMKNGGLISEFPSATKMTPELFPVRNRVIAGLSDCTIVVETDTKGGSIITANLANSYGREVFALPGRYNDLHSSGCNVLIRKNIGAIITAPEDLIDYLNWDIPAKQKSKQLPLFPDLNAEEKSIVEVLQAQGKTDIDTLCLATTFGFSRLSALLLDLEFKGIVRSIPGKSFEMV